LSGKSLDARGCAQRAGWGRTLRGADAAAEEHGAHTAAARGHGRCATQAPATPAWRVLAQLRPAPRLEACAWRGACGGSIMITDRSLRLAAPSARPRAASAARPRPPGQSGRLRARGRGWGVGDGGGGGADGLVRWLGSRGRGAKGSARASCRARAMARQRMHRSQDRGLRSEVMRMVRSSDSNPSSAS
jgi:hypothetical protein